MLVLVAVLVAVLVLVDDDVLVESFLAAASLAAFSCPPAVALAAVAASEPVPEAMDAVIRCSNLVSPLAKPSSIKRRRYVLRSGGALSPWADESSKEQMTTATTNARVRLMMI